MKTYATLCLVAIAAATAAEDAQKRNEVFATAQDKLDAEAGSMTLLGKDKGFKTPEACHYDKAQDKTFISNISGNKKNGEGFMSRLHADGKLDLKWIEGMNAPKGLYVSGDVLWVSDIDEMKSFNAKDGKPIKTYKLAGTNFLNDVFVNKAGTVYVSDSGLEPIATPSKYAIWSMAKDGTKFSVLLKDKGLEMPNGITQAGDTDDLLITSFGSIGVRQMTKEGVVDKPKSVGAMMIDGIEKMKSGNYAITSWAPKGTVGGSTKTSGAIYTGKMTGQSDDWKVEVDNLEAPADLGLNTKTNQIMVPMFKTDEVRIYSMDLWAVNRRGCARDCRKAADKKFTDDKKDDMEAWKKCNAACIAKFTGATYFTIGASILALAAALQ